jgi:hypothetical protein
VKPPAFQALAGVVRSAASAIAALTPLERHLRVLAATLDESETDKAQGRPRRAATSPKTTVPFTELDSKKAERALARLGIRNTK